MKVRSFPKEFKCPHCDKTKPTTECSNLISMGDWVCKSCFKTFGSDVLFVNDWDTSGKDYPKEIKDRADWQMEVNNG